MNTNGMSERPQGGRFKKVGLALMAAVVLAGGSITLNPATAGATSTKCAFYGDGIKGLVRNGQFCATVVGSGTRVDRVTANFGTTIPGRNKVCNPSIKIDVYNKYGKWVTWRQGAQKSGCAWGTWNSVRTLTVNANFPSAKGGFVRVSLQHYGSTVTYTDHRLG